MSELLKTEPLKILIVGAGFARGFGQRKQLIKSLELVALGQSVIRCLRVG